MPALYLVRMIEIVCYYKLPSILFSIKHSMKHSTKFSPLRHPENFALICSCGMNTNEFYLPAQY